MKIRNGFVSNSSSSSFVCIGKNIDLDDKEKKRILKYVYKITDEQLNIDEDELFDLFYNIITKDNKEFRLDWNSETKYFGIKLVSTDSSDYLDDFEFSISELEEKSKWFANKFGYNINDIKLIGGTEAC